MQSKLKELVDRLRHKLILWLAGDSPIMAPPESYEGLNLECRGEIRIGPHQGGGLIRNNTFIGDYVPKRRSWWQRLLGWR